jgi:hypothetical protein
MPASVTNLADSHRPQSLTPQVDLRSRSSIRAIRGPPLRTGEDRGSAHDSFVFESIFVAKVNE